VDIHIYGPDGKIIKIVDFCANKAIVREVPERERKDYKLPSDVPS
jgi:hypothetical protein